MDAVEPNGVEAVLRQRGAVFPEAGGGHALHFGQPHEEYLRLVGGCGWVVRSWASRLVLSGADRVRFLNAMMTCDISSPGVGEGVYGFFTGAKGRVLSDAVVRAREERLELELPEGTADRIRDHLTPYIVADRVEIEVPEERVLIDLAGPGATEFLQGRCEATPPDGWNQRSVELYGEALTIGASNRFGGPAYSAWIDPQGLERLLEASSADEDGPRPIGFEAWNTVRVERGALLFGRDFGPENLPQETGLDEAVSYTKGCYLGQEIVARLHYRGQAQRGPRGLSIAAGELPPEGAEILFEGRAAGRLTSVVRSPARGEVFGLTLLHRRAWEPGSRVEIDGTGEATVAAL